MSGGSGFNLETKLPPEIAACDYDWSIYPRCEFSIVKFSTGCIRNCPWCVVPKKEGMIAPCLPKNLNPRGKHIKVMDNNFFANRAWPYAIEKLREWNLPVDFQGVDARMIGPNEAEALNSIKIFKQIHIAWDDPAVQLEPKLRQISEWIKPWKLMVFVLIGFNSTEAEDLRRVEAIRSLGMDPFVMPFNKSDLYQRTFARWVNHKALFAEMRWNEYRKWKYI
jgi:hypothetical protein